MVLWCATHGVHDAFTFLWYLSAYQHLLSNFAAVSPLSEEAHQRQGMCDALDDPKLPVLYAAKCYESEKAVLDRSRFREYCLGFVYHMGGRFPLGLWLEDDHPSFFSSKDSERFGGRS